MASIRISRYVPVKELGRGGMATVYLVRDLHDNQLYALKVLPRQFTHDPMFRDRFARESKTVAQLHHEAIIPVYDFGEENGTPFIVMRYMPGGTLAERMARGRIGRQEAARILAPIAAALDYAHQRGIVHRDIKPANIFFDEQNRSYLGDFGVVKLAEATRSFSGTSVIGTPAYMSPEQVKGGGQISGRSDIYALAVVLFEMLTGRAPYQADTPTQQMMMHVLEPPPRLSAALPQAEPALEQILLKALAKDPDARYASAGEFIHAVATLTPPPQATVYGPATQRYAAGPTLAGPAAPLDAAQTGRPRRTWLMVGGVFAAGICALLAVGIALASYFGFPATAMAQATLTPGAAQLESPAAPGSPVAIAAQPTQPVTLAAQDQGALPTVTPLPDLQATAVSSPTSAPTATAAPLVHQPPAGRPPHAQHDNAETHEDTPIDIHVAGNDSDPDNDLDPDSARVEHGAPHGRVRVRGGGVLNYTPDEDYFGQDAFTYRICDRGGRCADADVVVNIQPVDDAPRAEDDHYDGVPAQALNVPAPGVLRNDREPDGDHLNLSIQSGPNNGALSLNPDGSFSYTPNGACGTDAFTYLLDDGQGNSDQAEVRIETPCIDGGGHGFSASLSGVNPPNGSDLNPSSQVRVAWEYANDSYNLGFIFWKIELLLFENSDCTGSSRPWGEVGFWARSPALGRGGSSDIEVQVQPTFQVFAPGGQYIGYVGVHLLAFAQQGESRSLGEQLAEDSGFCFPYR